MQIILLLIIVAIIAAVGIVTGYRDKIDKDNEAEDVIHKKDINK